MVSCHCQDGLFQLLFGIVCTSPRHRVVEQHTVARRATVALPPGRTAADLPDAQAEPLVRERTSTELLTPAQTLRRGSSTVLV